MNDDLHFDLDRAASGYDVPHGDLDAVVATARRRTVRRHRAIAVAAMVAVLGATVAAIQVSDDRDEVQLEFTDNLTRGDSGIEWRAVDARTSVGDGVVAGEGPLYALSTAAGERDIGKAKRNGVVWRSGDGVEWESIGGTGDLYLSDLSKRGDRLYGVGTAPSSVRLASGRAVHDVVVGWSDDDARTWRSARLPIDLAAMAPKAKDLFMTQVDLATTGAGTVAAVRMNGEPAVSRLLPTGVTAPNGWAMTEDGIDILGPARTPACPKGTSDTPPDERAPKPAPKPSAGQRVFATVCFRPDGTLVQVPAQEVQGVVRSIPFDELGVTGDARSAVLGEPMVFFAPPGSTDFKRVQVPAARPGTFRLSADDQGFLLTVGSYESDVSRQQGSVRTFHSADGKDWTVQNDAATPETWPVASGRLVGLNTVVAFNRNGGVLLIDDGRRGWRTQPLSSLLDPEVVGDATPHPVAAGIGRFGAVIVVGLEPAVRDVSANPEKRYDPRFRILATRDGKTWEDHAVNDVVGAEVATILRVVLEGDRAVVTATLRPPGDGEGRGRVVSVVATAP